MDLNLISLIPLIDKLKIAAADFVLKSVISTPYVEVNELMRSVQVHPTPNLTKFQSYMSNLKE